MFSILLPVIVLVFLAVGAVVFVVCGMVPPLRRFALSAALWCALWGPCAVAWIMLGGMTAVAEGVASSTTPMGQSSLLKDVSIGYLVVGVLGTLVVASLAAWLHQFAIHRITFALFRLYAGMVAAGLGCALGCSLGFGLEAGGVLHSVLICCLGVVVLCAAFGYAGYRGAKQLRGSAPTEFALVTREEFEGIP